MKTRSGKTYGVSAAVPKFKRRGRVSGGAQSATLNTRINRILSNRLETKRFFNDGNVLLTAFTQVNLYFNPFAGIANGNAANQRIGDKITVVGIEVYMTYNGENTDAMDQTWEGTLVEARTSGTYTSGTVTPYVGANLNYTGFNTNGPFNNEEYRKISQKRKIYKHPTLSVTTFVPQVMLTHKIKMNKTITYVGGTGSINPGDYLYILTNTTGGTAGLTQGTCYCNYIVYYKDA